MAAANIAPQTGLSALRELMSQMKHVYYYATPNLAVTAIGTPTLELPVLEDGVSFDTGSADIQRINLTTGDTWVSKATAGDPDISMQVASVSDAIASLFMTKTVTTKVETGDVTFNNTEYEGYGYSLAPKKSTGGLLFTGEPGEAMVFFPNVEMFSNLVLEDGDNPSYFNVAITPLLDNNNASFYPLTPKAS